MVDTSRNGNGSNGEWCNPEGRAIGVEPNVHTVGEGLEMELWVKLPGESDGDCGIGPGTSAGQFVPDIALELAGGNLLLVDWTDGARDLEGAVAAHELKRRQALAGSGARIDAPGGLVHHQHAGGLHHLASDDEFLQVAAGELALGVLVLVVDLADGDDAPVQVTDGPYDHTDVDWDSSYDAILIDLERALLIPELTQLLTGLLYEIWEKYQFPFPALSDLEPVVREYGGAEALLALVEVLELAAERAAPCSSTRPSGSRRTPARSPRTPTSARERNARGWGGVLLRWAA